MPPMSESFRSDSRATLRCSRMNSPRSRILDWRSSMLTAKRLRARASTARDGNQALAQGDEHLGHVGIELGAAHAGDLLGRVLEGKGGAVGPVGGHGVEGVDDAENARRHRDLLAFEPLRIARAVEHPVVVADDT